jgi:alpha/beta superfamily hydrolase
VTEQPTLTWDSEDGVLPELDAAVDNAAGERLAFTFHPAWGIGDVATAPVVVLCHGMESHRRGKVAHIARVLQQSGMSALRLDHAGCGDSEGPHEPIDVLRRVEDVTAVIGWLDAHHPDHGAVALAGSSMGAAVSLVAAQRLGAPAWAGIATPIRFWSVVRAEAKQFRGRGLVVWGDADEVVPPLDSEWLVHVLADRSHTLVFAGGDHRLKEHVPAIAKRMAYFFARFLVPEKG